MTAKKREELFEEKRKPRTGREQFKALQSKGFFGMWKDLIPEDVDSVTLARELRRNAESRLNNV